MKNLVAGLLLSAALATPAFAAESPLYAGVQVGDGYIGLLGGYQVDKMISVELHYYDFDTVSTPVISTDVSSIGVSAVAVFPLKLNNAPQISLFAKAGAERTTAKASSATIPGWNYTVHDTGVTLGGGAQYDFNNRVSARLGVDLAGEADSLYINALLKF